MPAISRIWARSALISAGLQPQQANWNPGDWSAQLAYSSRSAARDGRPTPRLQGNLSRRSRSYGHSMGVNTPARKSALALHRCWYGSRLSIRRGSSAGRPPGSRSAATSVHVHHHAGDAAVPVCERVDLTDEEDHEYGLSERAGQRSTCLKAAPECALHEAWGDELGGAGTVGSLLVPPGDISGRPPSRRIARQASGRVVPRNAERQRRPGVRPLRYGRGVTDQPAPTTPKRGHR